MSDTPTNPTSSSASSPMGRNWSAWISLVVMLALILSAGYALTGALSGSSADARDLQPVMPAGARGNWMRQLQQGGGAPGPRVQPDGVRQRGASGYNVRAGEFQLNATKSKDGKWTLRFTTDRRDMLTPEQDAAFDARWRLTRDSTYAKSLNVTQDQIKQLGEIPGKGGLIVSDQDQQDVQAKLDAYIAAAQPRTDQQSAVVAAVQQAGQNSLDPTRQSLLERVQKIESILTPEQLAKFRPGAR